MTFDIRHVGSYSGRTAAWIHVWQRCRDAVAGQDAVKFRGEFYLPRPPGMEDNDVFLFYLRNATWFDASSRTMQGMHGTLFRRLPQIPKLPPLYQERLDNITGLGHTILDLAKMAAWEQLIVGRYGVLVFPSDEHPVPRVSTWGAEQIIGIKYRSKPDGSRHLSHVRLMDTVETPELANKLRLRVIMLEIDEKSGYLVKRVFQSRDQMGLQDVGVNPYTPSPFPYLPYRFLWSAGAEGRLVGSWAGTSLGEITAFSWGDFDEDLDARAIPTRKGEPLDFIPFVLFEPLEGSGTTGLTPNPPPILGLVNENMAHYRASASYERARYRLSDPWVAIHDSSLQRELSGDKNVFQSVGGNRAFVMSSEGKITIAGLNPQALVALRDPMDMRRENMALLGSRLLETPRKLVEATKTHELRIGSENATLVDIADASERQLNELVRIILWWAGEDDDLARQARFSYQRDFIPMGLDPQRIVALLKSYQAGAITLETFLYNMKAGEGLPPGRTVEEEAEETKKQHAERAAEIMDKEVGNGIDVDTRPSTTSGNGASDDNPNTDHEEEEDD